MTIQGGPNQETSECIYDILARQGVNFTTKL